MATWPSGVVLALCAAASALLTAACAHAEKFSAEDRIAIERMFGERIDNALDLCLTDPAPDVDALEARAAAQGWPPFGTVGGWRVSNTPSRDEPIISFGLYLEPIPDAPIPGEAFTCSLLMPGELASMLRGHVADRFARDPGAYYLEDGRLREVPDSAWPDRSVPNLFARTQGPQRVVLVSTEDVEEGVAVRVTVLHRMQ